MALPNTKPVVFNDFSRGIVSYTRGVGGELLTEPGVAQLENTYRCIALPTGGLGPLPKVAASASVPAPALSANNNVFIIVGLDAIPQVLATGIQNILSVNAELHVGVVWAGSAAPFNASFAWYAIRSIDGNAVQLKLVNTTTASAPLFPTPFFTAKTRLRSPTAQANQTIVGSWEDQLGTTPRTWWWPDPADPAAVVPVELSTRSGALLAHDGSVLLLDWQSTIHGTGVHLSNEFLCFTSPPLTSNMGSQGVLFSPANPSGYGAWCSTAQSELFLVKTTGGVVVVSGDLSMPNPAVGTVPFAASAGLTIQHASGTPIGIIYCDESSVWLWNGQVSQNISRQMENGFFLRPDPIANTIYSPRIFNQRHISHTAWGDFVVFPNSYLLDTIGQGWWRLEDPAIAAYQLYTRNGQTLWATVGGYAVGSVGGINAFNLSSAASSYSWNSHPIAGSQFHYVDVREVEIVAQAASGVTSTVEIQLTNAANQTVSKTFTLTQSDQPMRIRSPIYAKGYNIKMRIIANSNDSAVPAPTVLQVTLSIRDASTTAST